MKRAISLVLATLLLLNLCACGLISVTNSVKSSDLPPASSVSDNLREEDTPVQKTEEDKQTNSSELDESEKPDEAEKPEQTTTLGIRAEFKEAMDGYEAFFNEYAEFMKKYAESDDTLSMLSDYASYLERMSDALEKLDELGEEEMNTAETLYYLEVTARIQKKLAEAAQ